MTPDRFLSKTQLQAVEFLEGCLLDLEPLAALTGGAGSGKTVALNALLARQENAARRVIRVNNFVAGPLSLHRVLASSFGVMDAGDLSAEALEPVLRRALVEAGRSEPPVLAVDDAQSLLPETLRYLCLLAGLREAGRPLLRIVLAGRPGFALREAMPRQFTLEALTPHDARLLVLHGFEAAGVEAPDEAVQDIVRSGQGNLRKLDVLLAAGIEAARTEGRRRITTRRGQMRAEVQNARPARRSAGGRWLVVPALLVVGAAALAIAYHDGMFGGRDGKPVIAAATTPPAVIAATQPPLLPAVPATVNPPSTAPSKLASVPLPLPPPPTPAANPAPTATTPAPASQAQLQVAPVQAPPLQTQAAGSVPSPLMPLPVVPLASSQTPAPDQTPASDQTPAPGQTPAANQTTAPDQTPAPDQAAASGQATTRFRIYNISACHQGVCPRWSVTDLDQQQHFVAAFNPATLHLDRDVLQKLREGSIDLVVNGSIARGGPDGRTLTADTLQQVAPHHGRVHLPSSSGSEPVELAPSQLQSPPPGFLPVPPPAR